MTNNYSQTKKTVALLLLLCIFLMTVLFVYRAQQTTNTKVYTSENATMFPVGREIKPFTLVTSRGEKFGRQNLTGHWTLLFFGFTHCATVCPITLDMLAHAYDSLITIKPNLQVVLMSLDPTRDDIKKLNNYVQSFHANFIGVSGKASELRKLQAQFRVFSEKEPTASSVSDEDYQIQHTASIFLINPKGEWAGIFSYGLKPDQFVYEFEMASNAAA